MEENNNKEINLLQLLTLLYNWFIKVLKNTINFFGNLIQLSYKFKILTIVVVAFNVSISLYLTRPSARIYKAEAMAMLYGSEAQTVKEVCKQLENSISSNNLYSLATKLSIPDSVAKNIVGFQSFYVIDYMKDKVADKIDFNNNHSLTDTLNIKMKDRLYFRVLSTNINQIPKVQVAILNYFNNNNVMKAQFANKRSELIQEIKICNNESLLIDSLAKVSYFKEVDKQLQFDKNKLIVGEQKKQLFYGELLDLQNIKSKAETQIVDFKQPVELPSGFVLNPIPLNGRVKYGVESIFIGYFIAVVISVLINNFKKIIKFLERK